MTKPCGVELAEDFGFKMDVLDSDGIPIGICRKKAKNSIVSKQAESVGGNIKQILFVCDEHFQFLKNAYEAAKFTHFNSWDSVGLPEKDKTCPCCGERIEKYASKLRFRKNRI